MNLILRVFREPILHSPTYIYSDVTSGKEEETAVREVFRGALDLYNNFRLLLDYLESDSADDLPFASTSAPSSTSSPFSSPLLPPTEQNQVVEEISPLTSTGENRRLVGRLLIEPAEDIALDSYSDSPEPLGIIWRLSELPDVLESLARSSRAIVHTVYRLKVVITTDSTGASLAFNSTSHIWL